MSHVAHRAQERAHVHVVTLRLERNCDMKRRTFGAACLIGIALAGGVRAQETGEAVLLRYHFQPGQEFRYRLTITGDMGMAFSCLTTPPCATKPVRLVSTMT